MIPRGDQVGDGNHVAVDNVEAFSLLDRGLVGLSAQWYHNTLAVPEEVR